MNNPDLKILVSELREKHDCHTIILYGSRANNTENENSDLDLACFKSDGVTVTDARIWNGFFLDAWIHPEAETKEIKNFLKLLDGKVLWQVENFGADLLKQVHECFSRGPEKLPENERQQRIIWCEKTFKRSQKNDPEGNFRRIWLAHDLLNLYFELRGFWYLGSKRSFIWLKENDFTMFKLFEKLYSPGGSEKYLEETMKKVINS